MHTLAGVSCAWLLAAAPAAPPSPVPVARTGAPIEVDAVLDEPAWEDAVPIPIAWEWFPADDAPAAARADALLTYDDRRLYVAFRVEDPDPARIRAHYHDRDDAGDDDLVGFMLDPFNDDRRAYQFRVNPLGVQMDAVNSDVEGTEDFAWDAVWDSAGRLTGTGWVVEASIPLQQLRVPEGSDRAWGFLAFREWPREVLHRFRSIRTDPDRSCLVCQFQDVEGVRAATSGHDVELTPTLTGSRFQRRDGDALRTASDEVDPGLDARWGLTSGTSLQLTANPDFSQVEADAAQLDVNTRFALFFPEKRPFFLEGADLFETQIPLAFTRTIADPAAGAKVTGKRGGNAYGVLVARDRITNVLVPGDQSDDLVTLDGGHTTALARYRRDVSSGSAVGGFLSGRDGDGYSNLVAAADGYVRLGASDDLRLQAAVSRTVYPAAVAGALGQPLDAFGGGAVLARYGHRDADWTWAALYLHHSPGFRADSGFVNQVGVRFANAEAQRRLRGGDGRWFSNVYLQAAVDATREWGGAWTEWGADLGFRYEGPRQSVLDLNLAPNQEHFRGVLYHNFRQSLFASIQPSRDTELGVSVSRGGQIDFANARAARFLTVSPTFEFRAGRRLEAEVAYAWQVFEDRRGARIFSVHLPQVRALFHLGRRSFLRAIVQYQALDRVPAQYLVPVDERRRDLLGQLLFSYRLDAHTVLLLGYSDTRDGTQDVPLRRTTRTVFAKVSYALLF